MTDTQKAALAEILRKLAGVPRPGFVYEGKGRRMKYITAEYIAGEHGFNKSTITRVLRGEHYSAVAAYVSDNQKCSVVTAIVQEAAKSGVQFTVEEFKDFLPHDLYLSLNGVESSLPLPSMGEGGPRRAVGEGVGEDDYNSVMVPEGAAAEK